MNLEGICKTGAIPHGDRVDAAVAGHVIGENAPTIFPVAREDGFAVKLEVPVILAENAETKARRNALASLRKTTGAG